MLAKRGLVSVALVLAERLLCVMEVIEDPELERAEGAGLETPLAFEKSLPIGLCCRAAGDGLCKRRGIGEKDRALLVSWAIPAAEEGEGDEEGDAERIWLTDGDRARALGLLIELESRVDLEVTPKGDVDRVVLGDPGPLSCPEALE